MKQYILLIIFINLIVIQFICDMRYYKEHNNSYIGGLVEFILAPAVILVVSNKNISKFLDEAVKKN
jgi:hypothetical protein